MRVLKIALLSLFGFILSGCQDKSAEPVPGAEPRQQFQWKLVTSWPKNFPGLGTAPETFARYVNEMSGGRLKVRVYGAGELVPGFEVFDAVSQGTAEMGHSGAYYWKGKAPAAPIFAAIPFGMNAQEMNAWLHYGGGLALWRELYQPFGIIPFAGGNSGVQMAGWFKKPINSLADMRGLKIRIPGLGGEVVSKLGAVPVSLTGGELFTALQTGAIDATEWVGPYNDLAFGLHKAAKYYYTSGWHEPGTLLEFIVNESAFNALPKDLQKIVEVAARATNQDMLDEYTARNNAALEALINQHGIILNRFPEEVMAALRQATKEVMDEQVAADPMFAKIYASYQDFYSKVSAYTEMSELQYYQNRKPKAP